MTDRTLPTYGRQEFQASNLKQQYRYGTLRKPMNENTYHVLYGMSNTTNSRSTVGYGHWICYYATALNMLTSALPAITLSMDHAMLFYSIAISPWAIRKWFKIPNSEKQLTLANLCFMPNAIGDFMEI
uniref:Uncharacterized protein n=1 Tax=Glossina pallidipes TaxID=7398 RepID=A0A1A9Z4T3_GLOPL